MLVKYQRYPVFKSPFDEMFNVDSMINKFFRGGVVDDGTFFPAAWSPAVDVAEHENNYLVNVELPGIGKDDVKITMRENVLTIEGEKKAENETKDKNYHRVERSFGKFQRSFSLPKNVKSDAIEAEYKDGVLSVSIPKAEEVKPKQIEVKVK